jgi:hypothetical protein
VTEIDAGPWISLAIRTFVFALFAYVLLMALRLQRADPSATRYRSLLMAIVIFVGVLALWMGAVARIWPAFLDTARAIGVMASGALLLLGLLLAVSYWRDEPLR